MQHIQFGAKRIYFALRYTKRKTLGIRVHPDAKVEVLAPVDTKEADVLEKVKAKAAWILKQVEQFNAFRPLTPPRRFINGETHLYLGRQYRLKIVPDTENAVKAYRGQLWIHAVDTETASINAQLQSWYKQRAAAIFEELLHEVLPRFRKYKIPTPNLVIRKMAKRWGSCTPGGKIILNLELIKAPKGCIEYVIIHELCHLVHHNHTAAFFSLLNRLLPDWQKWKDRLELALA